MMVIKWRLLNQLVEPRLVDPRDRIYVKGYGFLSFAKNMGKRLHDKLLDSAKKSTTDAIKTASKRATQKTAEATGALLGNKIADKITSVSKKKPAKELHNNETKEEEEEDVKIATHKKRYISPEEIQKVIDELRLVPKKDTHF